MKSLVLFFSLLISLISFGQGGTIDTTFNELRYNQFGDGSGADGGVAIAKTIIQPDGKLIIFGGLTNYNGTQLNGIVRLNPDGSIDHSFNANTGSNSSINSAILLSDGKILVAGYFTEINNTPAPKIARLNADGSLDSSFDPGSGTNAAIAHLALQSSGKIIISGYFTEFDGVSVGYIARLEPDGALDPTFNSTGADGYISQFVVRSSDNIVITGLFNNFNGTPVARLAEIDENGYLNSGFVINSITNVNSIQLQPDEKLLVSGLSEVNGISCNGITRLLPDGSIDPGFDIGTGPNSFINSTEILSNGKILVCGYFTAFDGVSAKSIARLFPSGTIDPTFSTGMIGPNSNVNWLKVLPDNTILIGGPFTKIEQFSRKSIARLNEDGSLNLLFSPKTGFSENVETIVVQPDNRILLGGDIENYNDYLSKGIVRLYPDGLVDPTFETGTGFDSTVTKICLQPDGKIIVAGLFTSYNGTLANGIIRLNSNGSIDQSFQPGLGINLINGVTNQNAVIHAIQIQSDNKILIGGDFTSFDGTNSPYLVRLNNDGSVDPIINMGSGPDGSVTSIVLQSDGKIIVGGLFSSINGNSGKIIRLLPDGTVDPSYIPYFSTIYSPISMAIDEQDNLIYAFSNTLEIYRVDSNGNLDISINLDPSIAHSPNKILPLANGQYIITYTYYSGLNFFSQLYRLNHDGSVDGSFSFGNCQEKIKTAAIQQNGEILIGGDFSMYLPFGNYYNFRSDHLARLRNDIPQQAQLSLYFQPALSPSCTDSGYVLAHGIAGIPPYSYTWSGGSLIQGAAAYFEQPGIYSCTVTDAQNNSETVSICLTGPVYAGSTDLNANLHFSSFRSGFDANVWIDAFNDGCIPVSGQLKLAYDPLLTFISSNPSPDSQNGDTLIWNFTNLTYDSTHLTPQILFNTSSSAVIGDTINLATIITPVAGDADTSNNVKNFQSPVINGYDPNIKSAYPIGKCEPHYIDQDQLLTYTIQFQNTGNSEAINIAVIDSLSNHLDLQTVRVVGNSHPVWTEVLPGNVLKFHFDNILLPDSTSNESESHGYVIFEVSPLSSWINHNTEIRNNADIYFDFNPPIRTNTVTHTIYHGSIPLEDYNCQGAGLTANNESLQLLVYPNPASESVTIALEDKTGTYAVILTDMQGRKLSQHTLNNGQLVISVQELPEGMYLLSVYDENKTHVVSGRRINKLSR